MINARFEELFGSPARRPGAQVVRRRVMDLAASSRQLRGGRDRAPSSSRERRNSAGAERRLVMAGGIALNCVANGRVLREGPACRWLVRSTRRGRRRAARSARRFWLSYSSLVQTRNVPAGADSLSRAASLDRGVGAAREWRRFSTGRGHRISMWPIPMNARRNIVAGALAEGKIVGHFQRPGWNSVRARLALRSGISATRGPGRTRRAR